MIKMISIPRLKLQELRALADGSIQLTEPIAQLATEVADVQATFALFRTALHKEQAASDRSTLDKTRDYLISSFLLGVKSEAGYPYDDTVVLTQVKAVSKVADKYGFGINKLPYAEQSAQVDSMLEDLDALDMTAIPGLSRWLPQIKAANDAFKNATTDYVKDITASQEVSPASEVAPELLEKLEGLYGILHAHAQLSASDEIVTAYKEIVTLVDQFR